MRRPSIALKLVDLEHATRATALGSVVSVSFGRLCGEHLHAISYLICKSPSVNPAICDLSAILLRNLTATARCRSSSVCDPAIKALERLECSAPPHLPSVVAIEAMSTLVMVWWLSGRVSMHSPS